MKTSYRHLLAPLVCSIAVHAGLSFLPFPGQHVEAIRHIPAGRSPAPDFAYIATIREDNMRAPTSLEGHDSLEPDGTRQSAQPGSTNAKAAPGIGRDTPSPLAGEPFFPTSQLSRPAQPAAPVVLAPGDSGLLLRPGRSVLTLWIDSRGNVVEARIESSDVPEQLARIAVDAFRHTLFIPGERNGRQVGAVMRVEVRHEELIDLPA